MSFNPLAAFGEATLLTPIAPGTLTGTCVAATPKILTFDCSTVSRLSCAVGNTGGSNAIGTTTIEKSPNGVVWFTDSQVSDAIGSLAAGGTAGFEFCDCAFAFLRVTMTSSSGSTYSIDIKGVR